MIKKIIELIESLKADKKISSMDVASIKQGVIIRLLSSLGWDIFNVDEIKPDLVVGSSSVDYALRVEDANKLFLMVRGADEELESSQKELLDCAVKEDVELAILTNGAIWWFYLPLSEDSPEQRRFFAVNLLKQNSKNIAPKFIEFLKKGNVSTGKSLNSAKLLKKKRQTKAAEKTISIAWRKLLSEPNKIIVRVLNETVSKMCGFEADKDVLAEFLAECAKSGSIPSKSEEPVPQTRSYEGSHINGFSLKGSTFKIQAWEELIGKLCEVLTTKYKEDIERLLWHSVENRFFFNESPDELRLPANINGTNIFVETGLNPDDTVKLAHSVLSVFGYSNSDLMISTRKG